MSSWLTTSFFFFFNDTATTEIYTLSLHDALPICSDKRADILTDFWRQPDGIIGQPDREIQGSQQTLRRSEEHTSELQSRLHLVCRLLLEKQKQKRSPIRSIDISRVHSTFDALPTG